MPKAGDYYRAAVAREQKSAYAWFHFGTWYEGNDLMGDAAQAYDRAAEIDPTDPLAFESAARCYARLKNWSAASRNYDYAIAISPDRPELYIACADVMVEQQRYERATQYLWTARSLIRSGDQGIHERLVRLYKLMHESESNRQLPQEKPAEPPR